MTENTQTPESGALCECCSDRPGVPRLADGGEVVSICDPCFDSLLAVFRAMEASGSLVRIDRMQEDHHA